jgi:hypothetical protein
MTSDTSEPAGVLCGLGIKGEQPPKTDAVRGVAEADCLSLRDKLAASILHLNG